MPDSLVIDATCAVYLLVPGPDQPRYEALVGGWKRSGYDLYAPALWIYEVTSALCKAVRFGGLTDIEGKRCLAQALNLGIRLVPADDEQTRAAYAWTLRLNRAAAYDSFYLALAERLSCELWTADRRLCHAVDASWVRFVGEGETAGL